MKVIYIHQHFSTPKGASGIRSYQMARRLIDEKHEVTMVCGSYSGGNTGLTQPFYGGIRKGIVDDINVIEFDLSYSNHQNYISRSVAFFKFAIKSSQLILIEEFDIVFATSTPLTAGLPGIIAKWVRKKKFIFEVRDLWPELPRAMGIVKNPIALFVLNALEAITYRSATRLIGLSPGMVAGIVRKGISPNLVKCIPNGCDLDIFSIVKNPWRPKTIKNTDIVAIFSGTHGVANGLDIIIDVALELKRRQRDDIKIILIGQGSQKSTLMSLAQQNNLDCIIFHEPVSKQELSDLFSECDIGLQILANIPEFYYGTSPNKFFDYIAAGLPVINNYPGWVADLIQECNCGFVVNPDDPISFADALEFAANNKIKLKQMGVNATALAKKEFDRTVLSSNWVKWVIDGPDAFSQDSEP